MRRSRPVLVPSADAFNRASALLLVVPIAQGGTAPRETGFSVTLMGSGTATQDVVLCDQTHTSLFAPIFRKGEKVPAALVKGVLDMARSLPD